MNSLLEIPKELLDELEKFPQAKERFLRLPPSHKREHIAYFTEAKKTETRIKRISLMILKLMQPQEK